MTLDPAIGLKMALDRAEAQAQQFAEHKRALQETGSSVYTPAEMTKRTEQLVTEFDTQLAVPLGNVDAEVKAAETALAMEAGRDPMESLPITSLQEMAARAPFAQDDAEHLPLGELHARCEAAVIGLVSNNVNDKARASALLIERYVPRRVARERKALETTPDSLSNEDLRTLRKIDASLAQISELTSDHKKRQTAAQSRLDAAKKARLEITVLRNRAVAGDLARLSHAGIYQGI